MASLKWNRPLHDWGLFQPPTHKAFTNSFKPFWVQVWHIILTQSIPFLRGPIKRLIILAFQSKWETCQYLDWQTTVTISYFALLKA